MFESIIATRLSEFLLTKIGPQQHGFMKGRSVLTNLLLYNEYIFSAINNHMQVDSIYIDFSKAFDTVHHARLLAKIWNAGVRETHLGSFSHTLLEELKGSDHVAQNR